MLWLKRNLVFVLGSVVGLALLGGAGYYLFTTLSENKTVDDQLGEAQAEADRLAKLDPYPNNKNIEAVKAEQQRVQEYITQAMRAFQPMDYHKMNASKFRGDLQNTIARLKSEAEQLSVAVPTNYNFSFEAQSKSVSFASNSIPMLSEQLVDISSICSVLFHARINKLEGIKRVRVSQDDPPGSADYVDQRPITNALTGAVLSPYEISILCFTPELAATLEGLMRSAHGFIVQTLTVEPAPASALPTPAPETPPPAYFPPPIYYPSPMPMPNYFGPKGDSSARPGMNNRMMMDRYMRRPPPPVTPPPQVRPAGTTAPAKTLTTVLNEKVLRVIVRVEVLSFPRAAEAEKPGGEVKKPRR